MIIKAKEVLKKTYGHHVFRPGQQELVEGLLDRRDPAGYPTLRAETGNSKNNKAPKTGGSPCSHLKSRLKKLGLA